MPLPSNIYITSDQFGFVLSDLNYSVDEPKQQELLDRATGDLEADLAEKFVVPLEKYGGGAFSTCPQFSRNKVLNAIKAKIRQIIGVDQNRNLVIDSTERYIDTHGRDYKQHIEKLLDHKIDYGFALINPAEDAREQVQHLGLARGYNNTDPNTEDDYRP